MPLVLFFFFFWTAAERKPGREDLCYHSQSPQRLLGVLSKALDIGPWLDIVLKTAGIGCKCLLKEMVLSIIWNILHIVVEISCFLKKPRDVTQLVECVSSTQKKNLGSIPRTTITRYSSIYLSKRIRMS